MIHHGGTEGTEIESWIVVGPGADRAEHLRLISQVGSPGQRPGPHPTSVSSVPPW